MRTLARLAISALLALTSFAARAEDIVMMLSTQDVAITSNFTGTRVTLFGAIERDFASISRPSKYDIVVTVSGPSYSLQVRQKEHMSLLWINRTVWRYDDVPGYFALLTTGPLNQIANEPAQERFKMGMTYQLPPLAQLPAELNPDRVARDALFRIRKRQGLLIEDARAVQLQRPHLFSVAIPLPAQAPTGRYLVTTTVLADGVPLKTASTSFTVRKIGFEAYVAAYARDNGWLYGLTTCLMALAVGFLGNLIFRRD